MNTAFRLPASARKLRDWQVLPLFISLLGWSGAADAQSADTAPPSAPGTPSYTVVSSSRIDLGWPQSTDNVGVAGYRIFRNGSTTPLATVEFARYADISVAGSTTYTYTVRAFDAAGNVSNASAVITARTPSGPSGSDTTSPTVPGTPAATAVGTSRIDLTWTASTDAVGISGYRIYRNGSTTPLATVTATNYSDTGLAASTTYSYTVRAFDAAGNVSSASGAGSARTQSLADTTSPTTPGTPAATAVGTSRIDLTWAGSTDAVGVSGYRIYRNGSTTPLATVTATNYSDTGLAASTTYSYTVRAFDAAGNVSSASGAGTASTSAPSGDVTPPSAPGTPTYNVVSSSRIDLGWAPSTDNVGVAGYRIYRNGSTTPLATEVFARYADISVAGSTTYTYTVRAFDAAGNMSNASATITATTPAGPSGSDTTAPTVPGTPAATAVGTSRIDLTWTGSTDAVGVSGYRIYRNGSTTPLATVTATNYSDTGLTASTTYSYTVRAFDAAGNVSNASGAGSASTQSLADTTSPTTPGTPAATAVGASRIDLSWTASTDAVGVSGYRIYRNGSTTPLATVTATNYSDTGLAASTTYSYTVRAFDAAGNVSNASGAGSASTSAPSGDVTPPSAPGTPSYTVVSSSRIDLGWAPSTDNVGVAGYRIYRNGSTTPLATEVFARYADISVAGSTTYTYTVRAFDAAGNVSNASATITATTPAGPSGSDTVAPTVPGTPAATAISSTRIDLTWTASTDAVGVSGYRIYRNGSTTPLTTVASTNYSDTGLTASTTYSYTVRAFDAAGNVSNASGAGSARTQASSGQGGLDTRPSNNSCFAWDRPTGGSSISLSQFTNLTFNMPVKMLQAPNSSQHWYVLQQLGTVRRFTGTNPSSATTVLDITGRVFNVADTEAGLLGMAFHPNFPTDSRVFIYYIDRSVIGRLSAFTATVDGTGAATINAASEQNLLSIQKPFDNHNGGDIAFGPDGNLYLGTGDGGGGGDPNENGQRLTTLLGKMLRITVGAPGAGYTIPSDNPFAGNAQCPAGGSRPSGNCPEIYAWGLRNPWRWSFDRNNGDLWVADVGQASTEEVNVLQRGGNYGWDCREGAHNFETAGCPASGLIDPIAEYDHELGGSITGGYVYRGSQPTSLVGRYLFADFLSGRIWAWIPNPSNPSSRAPTQLLQTTLNISSFGQGTDGELYVVNFTGGTLHRINFQGGGGGGTAPATLSATGCVNPANATQPASGLIPFSVSAPFWSDGATKERWMALPNNTNISVGSNNDWDFPNSTVLMKNFRVGTRLIETRLFMRHPDGNWGGFSYEWNAQQTDANLVQGGAVRDIGNGQQWIFPNESQCLQCHTSAAGRSLGLETAQLNRSYTYPQTGRTANQLLTLNSIGLFNPSMADPTVQPTIPDPDNTSEPLATRARAYLHTNCAQCHRPGGPTSVNLDLRYTTSFASTNTCNVTPQAGDLGVGANARLIAPGSAANSILINRVNRRDGSAMPPLGTNRIDTAGVALLTQWVNSLSGCN